MGKGITAPCPYPCEGCPFPDCKAVHFRGNTPLIHVGNLPPELRPQPDPHRGRGGRKHWKSPITGPDFRLMRQARRIGLQAAALQAGLNRSTLSNWESGKYGLSREKYDRLASAFDWVPRAAG